MSVRRAFIDIGQTRRSSSSLISTASCLRRPDHCTDLRRSQRCAGDRGVAEPERAAARDGAGADRPSPDGKPSGEIRAGAEVKAIGLVAGKHWVQIELPDHSLAYVPRAAIEFENDAGAPSAPAAARGAAPTGAEAAPPPTTTPPAATPAAALRRHSWAGHPGAECGNVGRRRSTPSPFGHRSRAGRSACTIRELGAGPGRTDVRAGRADGALSLPYQRRGRCCRSSDPERRRACRRRRHARVSRAARPRRAQASAAFGGNLEMPQ